MNSADGPKTYEWLTTSPNPRTISQNADDGQRGWRLHLVEPGQKTRKRMNWREDKENTIDVSPALCGLVPRHGWGLDLFICDVCERCDAIAEKRGIETPKVPD